MRNQISAILAAVIVFFCGGKVASGIHANEMEICTDTNAQANPHMFEYFIVWQDNRNGNWDIYGYDLDKGIECAICTADGNQTNPSIGFGSILDDLIIAWEDDRNGNSDIYGFKLDPAYLDLRIGTEITICTDPFEQRNPSSMGRYVVWQDNRNGDWDIYAIDYSAEPGEPNEIVICDEGGDQTNPHIEWPWVVVWQDNRNGDWDIYGLDMEDQNEWPICVEDGDQTNPSTSLHGFTWQDGRNGNYDIYAAFYRTILSGLNDLEEFPICIDSGAQLCPTISRDSEAIVWQDNRNGSWDIYGWQIDYYPFGTEFVVSAGEGERSRPVIYKHDEMGEVRVARVVWQDNRNGNDDIYAGDLCWEGNDDCGSCAIELFDGQAYTGSTKGMSATYIDTPSGPEVLTSSCGFNDFIDVWHIYRPAAGGPVTITTEDSTLDTILSVYNSCFVDYPYDPNYVQEPIELACNDDYCLENPGSRVFLNVVKGKTHYIRVSGYNNETGDYRIVVKRGAPGDPITSDLNGDGKVDWSDFAIFSAEWLMSTP